MYSCQNYYLVFVTQVTVLWCLHYMPSLNLYPSSVPTLSLEKTDRTSSQLPSQRSVTMPWQYCTYFWHVHYVSTHLITSFHWRWDVLWYTQAVAASLPLSKGISSLQTTCVEAKVNGSKVNRSILTSSVSSKPAGELLMLNWRVFVVCFQ